ncbi:hypothetical protein T492DRAFT_936884 [Pavlovales sp. CCMP2436]|nr:hypothetical protein T492DRAFT_936884 [Pavlovales sp. CCMP2436]
MRTAGMCVKHAGLEMPLRIVSETWLPRSTAPLNSKMAAITIALRMVSALEPIEVAKALATSLAPMPKAVKKAKRPPRATIHVYCP